MRRERVKAYDAVMQSTAEAVEQLGRRTGAEAKENSQYAIPLAFRKADVVQDGFRGSRLHFRAENRARGSFLLPQGGVCDV